MENHKEILLIVVKNCLQFFSHITSTDHNYNRVIYKGFRKAAFSRETLNLRASLASPNFKVHRCGLSFLKSIYLRKKSMNEFKYRIELPFSS